jgi:CBS domain-containing protein
MLHRVFAFADLTAGQVMIPRTEVVAIPADATRSQIVDLVAPGHAHLPVYRGDLDHVVGMLYVTDLLRAMTVSSGEINAAALAREVLTVPETLGADDLLAEMRRRGAREALVIDEYGGTAGLVTFDRSWANRRRPGDRRPRRESGAAARRVGQYQRPGARARRQQRFGLHIDARRIRPWRVRAGMPRPPTEGRAASTSTAAACGWCARRIRVATVWLSKGRNSKSPGGRPRKIAGLQKGGGGPCLQPAILQSCWLSERRNAASKPGSWARCARLRALREPDHAVLVDHEHGPLGNSLEADHVLVEHAVIANHLFIEIAEERETQLLLIVKCFQREERVGADPEHLGIRLAQLAHRIAKGAELLLTGAAERGGKKRQHHGLAFQPAERYGLALLVHQGETELRTDV